MRFFLGLLCCALTASPLFAQSAPVNETELSRLKYDVDTAVNRYESRVRVLSKGIKRDAFIVGQMVLAARDLPDFQKIAAVQKAIDRVEAATKRAAEDPPAGGDTMVALSHIDDEVRHAREQGTMADTEALAKTIIDQTHFIERDLFRAVALARDERESLTRMQTKITEVNLDVEASMLAALNSTFEFIQAGGK